MERPKEPDPSECCGSGCTPCIFDIYESQLARYEQLTSNKNSEPPSDLASTSSCISQTRYSVFQLVDVQPDSKDTNLYTFKYCLQNSEKTENFGLVCSPGQHFLMRGEDEDWGEETDGDCYKTEHNNNEENNSQGNKHEGVNEPNDNKDSKVRNFETEENSTEVKLKDQTEDPRVDPISMGQRKEELQLKDSEDTRSKMKKLKTKYFTRAYTPLSSPEKTDPLTFRVLIKLYNPGKMSHFLSRLEQNARTFWRGPYGNYQLSYRFKHLLMVCQGTGIAPLYCILNKLIENEDCETFLKLLYCCRCHDSIHLRDGLYKMGAQWNFTYEIFLSRHKGEVEKKYNEIIHCRRLEHRDIENYFAEKSRDNFQVLICGTDSFCEQIKCFLTNCAIDETNIFVF